MARDFRRPERRQGFLLPPDMQDWLPQDDIVHLVLDAVSLMDLSKYEAKHRVGGVGQAPFAPSMLLTLLIYAYSHGVKSSRAIERLCRRDAGYRYIVCEHVPDHTVIARFRRRHIDRLPAVFATVLRMCRDAGLIRLGLVVLDGTKVKANASLDANRSAATIDEQVTRMLAEAESVDQREDRQFGPEAGRIAAGAVAARGTPGAAAGLQGEAGEPG
ncbi:transposase [Tistrella bauzanensis]